MKKFSVIAGDLLANKEPSASLLTSVGALQFPHLENQVIVFSWSPLFPLSDDMEIRSHVLLTPEQVNEAFTSWLIPIVARVVPFALKTMRDRMKGIQNPCFFALTGVYLVFPFVLLFVMIRPANGHSCLSKPSK